LVLFIGTYRGMEDVAKIPYLTGIGPDRKLKRNVPPDLRKLAQKWAWVERPRGRSSEELKRQAHLFALRTSAEIASLRRQKERKTEVAEGPISLKLDDATAKELALLYFREMDDLNMREGAYAVNPADPAYQDILEDATGEYITARAASAHAEIGTSRTTSRISECICASCCTKSIQTHFLSVSRLVAS
jgi:hypothetical protein